MRRKQFLSVILCLAGALSGGVAAHGFTITPDFFPQSSWTSDEEACVQQAITDWTSAVSFGGANDQNIDLTFYFTSAGKGSYLAQWQFSGDLPVDFPYSQGIAGLVAVNNYYLTQDSFDLSGPVDGEYDMLTAFRHELGHMMGFAPGVYTNWNNEISGGVFDPNGLNIPMAGDNAHVNLPGDLMYFSLPTGVRKDISPTDLWMLQEAYGYTILTPEPGSLAVLGLGCGVLLRRRKRA